MMAGLEGHGLRLYGASRSILVQKPVSLQIFPLLIQVVSGGLSLAFTLRMDALLIWKTRATLTRHSLGLLLAIMLMGASSATSAQVAEFDSFFQHTVPLEQSSSGSLVVAGNLGGVDDEFLLDTGANLVTINDALFKQLKARNSVTKVREIGGRLASGRIEVLPVYRVSEFRLGANCNLGPVEVAVLKKGGRNLLGMNALQNAAPFAISTSPPNLGLARCSTSLH